MALGLSSGGGNGEIRPYIKYDARAGRMFRVEREQNGDGSYSSIDHDITNGCSFVADIANIKVGWVHYSAQGPVKRFVTLGKEPIPARPDDKGPDGKPVFKQGFEITILLAKGCGGGPAREFGSSAGCVIEAIDQVHDAYLAAPEAKAGKLPIIAMIGAKAVRSGQSSNYQPDFQISGWVDRPAALTEGAAQPAQAAAVAAQPPAPAAPVAPASAGDFG